ncbi:uncharacterized protein KY384_005867 [Bacidia gigantensis]|uniref:uncharacterized protein n=1 Tax=Bacidia gigantensis TaxID=2732470 RepID=UPI001D05629D|nr:uncharacterized protein KY384_005867 [Bacidia gigantensis]KAG8529232.1 hypothetical protein KY384_005867 [Bacidia gigantensis]
MSVEIEFFDLPSKSPCKAWSINTLRTRFILNYKNIPYKTTWVEYPDIEPTFKSFGIPANESGTAYTVPTIKLPDGRYLMDSQRIAQELEKLYPEPSLYLDDPILQEVLEAFATLSPAIAGVYLPKCARNVQTPRSKEYFERTRSAKYGMPLDQLEQETGGDDAFKRAKPGLKMVGEVLRAKGGPFCLGEVVSYADIVILGASVMFERIGEGVFEKFVEIEPSIRRLVEASGNLLDRVDH